MFELHNPQMLMYFADRQGAGQACLLCGSVLLPGKADIKNMQRAANEVYRINDGLRTRFIEKDGKVYQEAKPYEEREYEVLRFESREAMDKWAGVYATIPLTLDRRVEGSGVPKSMWHAEKPSKKLLMNVLRHNTKMLLTRAKMGLLRQAPSCCDLRLVELPDSYGAIVKLHHVIADGWTVMLVANQFIRFLKGETPVAYSYEDFIKSEAEYAASRRYERDCRYMEEQFARCPEPTWVWPEPYTSLEASRKTVKLDAGMSGRIHEYARTHDMTPYALFMTALCVYMRRKLRREQFYIGSVVLNRTGVRERNTAGMFVHGVPLLMELHDTDSFADALIRVRDTSFSGFRHQKGTAKTRDTKKLLYDVWISYQDMGLEADAEAECTQYYCNYTIDTTIFTIEDRSRDGSFTLHFDHNVKVTEPEVDELFRTVLGVLSEGMEDDGRLISELCVTGKGGE